MQTDLFPSATRFAASREDALADLAAFVPRSGRYSRDRNKVVPCHQNVSRLSPAIRHRLLLEDECIAAVLERYAPSTVEKFVQEVLWRRYWKAWLSMRPQVWIDYLADLEALRHAPLDKDAHGRIKRAEAGESNVAIMNHFARELTETGYLHNHARMWFAGWWVHVARLPWQLGADFFFRHLLDADPASNTLSWRWVAGLQTPGKTYLPRRSNIEKYIDDDLLAQHREGLEHLERPRAFLPEVPPKPEITARDRTVMAPDPDLPTGLWVHEEDLLPNLGPIAKLKPTALFVGADCATWNRFEVAPPRRAWQRAALTDTSARASHHFERPTALSLSKPLLDALPDWAATHGLRQVVALRPEVGPLADQLPALTKTLAAKNVSLVLLDRAEDLELRPLANGGFFGFWKKRCALMDR